MDPENYDELDRIIDRGLASYIAVEPLAGIEERVMNRVRLANAGRRRFGWRHWAVALPAIAALVVLTFLSRSRHAPVAEPKPIVVAHGEISAPPPAAPVKRATIARRAARQTVGLPKRDQFPTPSPITPVERALIAIGEFPPLGKSSEEIQIAPIDIPPLEIDGSR